MKKVIFAAVVLCMVFGANAQSYRLVHAMLTNNNTDTTVITIRDRMVRCNKSMCGEWLAGSIDSTSLTNSNRITVKKVEEFCQRTFGGTGTEQRVCDMFADAPLFKSNGLAITDAQLRTAWLNRVWIIISRIGEGSY